MTVTTERRAAPAAALLRVGATQVAAASSGGGAAAPADAPADPHAAHADLAARLAGPRGGQPEEVAFLLYPGCTALDFVGPHNMLRGLMGASVRLVAKTRDPIVTDTRLAVLPDTTFAECPERLTVLCVPGGTEGTLAAMADAETMAFLADRGRRAQ
jgi:hypothetical protein